LRSYHAAARDLGIGIGIEQASGETTGEEFASKTRRRERKMTQHLFRTYFGTRRNIIERRALVAERAAPLGQ